MPQQRFQNQVNNEVKRRRFGSDRNVDDGDEDEDDEEPKPTVKMEFLCKILIMLNNYNFSHQYDSFPKKTF